MMSLQQHSPTDVHLWKCELKKYALTEKAKKILSAEEHERMSLFRSEEDANRYAIVHVLIREVLAKYLHESPEKIEFLKGPHGKPLLKTQPHQPVVEFNVSYRNEYALLVVSTVPIGVDIEEIITIHDLHVFSSHYFSQEEKEEIMKAVHRKDQLVLLFTLWTMKEALIKALGLGLSGEPGQYNLYPFLSNKVLIPSFDRNQSWFISSVDVSESYRAALALPSNGVDLKLFDYGKK